MKSIKYFFITLLTMVTANAAIGAITGDWVYYPTFDNSVTDMTITPKRVYFMGHNQQVQIGVAVKENTDKTLFYYDIEKDQLIGANRGANLSNTAVSKISYNKDKGYLLIVYSDYNIDLLYDNGKVVNIPSLKHADMPGSKKINNISFDAKRNDAWLATDFGYVIINDERGEIRDSRNYGVKMLAAAAFGDIVMLSSETTTYYGNYSDMRLDLASYNKLPTYVGQNGLYPLSDKRILCYLRDDQRFNYMKVLDFSTEEPTVAVEAKTWGDIVITPSANGYRATIPTATMEFDPAKNFFVYTARPESDGSIMPVVTWDAKEYFTAQPRKGVKSWNSEGTVTRNFMLPDTPNAFWSRGMAYHPNYGMLVNSHGAEMIFNGTGMNSIKEPILLCGLKNGSWTPLSPAYRYPAATDAGYNPLGLLIDPAESKYIWSGSNFSGIIRINLDDPNDLLHYSFPGDPTSNLPGYVETNPIQPEWTRSCQYAAPSLDVNNTMWSLFNNRSNTSALEFRYLTDSDRRASKDAASARPWQKLVVNDVPFVTGYFTTLRSSYNKNLLLYMTQDYFMLYDTNGTPGVSSDDKKMVVTPGFYDQDGGEVSLSKVNCGYEDPSTGFVWFGTGTGVFYLQPRNIMQGQKTVNRIKVARNDGTSLADYLLNGVGVNSIVTDPQGRKWFGSMGAGIVVTSADGKTVYDEFTTANSDIPSDNVYNLCYNPSTRSMMVSTDKGLCEFFLGGSSLNTNAESEVRAYPNPVTPEYYGWVTIDGLPDDSLVKVVDAQGNLVKELGTAESGSIQWDINNIYSKRVNTGVYYILSSPRSGTGESNVAKILIMN